MIWHVDCLDLNTMPRKNLIRSDVFPYHITARVNNKEAFPILMSEMWTLTTSECYLVQLLYEVEIHALVLMPNHFHLLMTVPFEEFDLGKVMNRFMSDLTLHTHQKSGRSGRLFGKRYHWSLIQSSRYYGHALKYVYRNPVKGGLCETVEDYPFSTLHGLVGRTHLPFPIQFTRAGLERDIPDPKDGWPWLDWLNRPFPNEVGPLLRKALKQKELRFLLDQRTRRPESRLEDLL